MKNYALIGNPVHQSPTPAIMNDLFRMNGVDAFYTAIPLPINRHFAEFQGIFDGYNITYPFKRNAGGNLYIPGYPVDSTDGEAFFRTIGHEKTIAIKGINGGTAKEIVRYGWSLGCKCFPWLSNTRAEVYVNATPGEIELDIDPLFHHSEPEKDILIYDLRYVGSKLIESAKKDGFKTKDGKEMLIWNSILSFRKFIGKEPSRESRDYVFKKYGGAT